MYQRQATQQPQGPCRDPRQPVHPVPSLNSPHQSLAVVAAQSTSRGGNRRQLPMWTSSPGRRGWGSQYRHRSHEGCWRRLKVCASDNDFADKSGTSSTPRASGEPSDWEAPGFHTSAPATEATTVSAFVNTYARHAVASKGADFDAARHKTCAQGARADRGRRLTPRLLTQGLGARLWLCTPRCVRGSGVLPRSETSRRVIEP